MQSPFLNLEYLFYLIYSFFTGGLGYTLGSGFDTTLLVLKIMLWTIAFLCAVAIAYLASRIKKLQADMERGLLSTTTASAKPATAKNAGWERYKTMIDGDNPAEWKIVILEADKMLEALTLQLGFVGDTLGERLKNADTARMTTLQSAWEAHKVRNQIAHEPNHVLTKREARRVFALFDQVFSEFGLV